MSTRIISQSTATLLRAADRHGAKIAPKLRATIQTQIEAVDGVTGLDLSGPTTAQAVMTAISEGRNPVEDTAVLHAIVRDQLGSGETTAQLADTAREILLATITNNIDDIVGAFRTAFNDAGIELTKHADTLRESGIEDLEARALTRANLTNATAAVKAREAIARINDIENAVNPVLVSIGRLDGTPLGRIVRFVEPGTATAHDLLRLTPATPWTAATAGLTVSLATPGEISDRVARANANLASANREASRDHAQEARAAEYARLNPQALRV